MFLNDLSCVIIYIEVQCIESNVNFDAWIMSEKLGELCLDGYRGIQIVLIILLLNLTLERPWPKIMRPSIVVAWCQLSSFIS